MMVDDRNRSPGLFLLLSFLCYPSRISSSSKRTFPTGRSSSMRRGVFSILRIPDTNNTFPIFKGSKTGDRLEAERLPPLPISWTSPSPLLAERPSDAVLSRHKCSSGSPDETEGPLLDSSGQTWERGSKVSGGRITSRFSFVPFLSITTF